MKVRYRQNDACNCGLYAVANAVNDDKIIKPERLVKGVNGHHILQLNNYLQEDGEQYYIETLYKSIYSLKLPKGIEAVPDNPALICPLLMTVAFREGGKNHLIALRSFSDRSVQVIDSLREDIITTTFAELHEHYPVIFGLYAFVQHSGKDGEYMMLTPQ